MYCNHRNDRKPGACEGCWRFAIIIWSLLFVGVVVLNIVGPQPFTLGSGAILLVLAAIIGESIRSKWKGGDR